MKRVALALGTLLLLTGCATADAPELTPEPVAEVPEAEAPEGWEFCEAFAVQTFTYVDYIAELTDVEGQEFAAQERDLERVAALAPASIDSLVDDYAQPVRAIRDAIDSGEGTIKMNMDAFKASVPALMGYCVDDVGYKKP